MRKTRFYVPALILTTGLLTVGSLPVRADDKADITALYTKITAAMKAKNTKAIMALGTSDFTETENGQKMDAKQTVEMMDMMFKMTKQINSISMKPTKIDIKGGTAVVMANFSVDSTVIGQDKKTHRRVDSGTSKDTLVKTKKGWLFQSVEGLSSKSMMDGKPVATGAPAPSKK